MTSNTAASHPAVIRSNAAGGNAYISPKAVVNTGLLPNDQSNFNVSHMTFLRLGTAAITAVYVGGSGNQTRSFSNVVFDACGKIYLVGATAGDSFSFSYVTWKNSTGAYTFQNSASAAPAAGALRLIDHCVFDIPPPSGSIT